MKVYLNRKLESIPIFKNLITLLTDFFNSDLKDELLDIENISEIRHLYDPVMEFIEYYLVGSNQVITDDHKLYILNSLYMTKGSPRIFEMLEELLEIKIEYRYDFPVIEIIRFHNLKLTNVSQFITKFTNMLYYLIYYTKLRIKFKDLILSLQGNLINYNTTTVIEYRIHDNITVLDPI